MPDPTPLLITVATVTRLLPIAFLVAVAYAAGRRRRGIPITGRLSGFLTVLGGMSIGVFLLTGADLLIIVLPILGSGVLLAWFLWRRRKRIQAGQLLVGMAIPWVILWTFYLVLSPRCSRGSGSGSRSCSAGCSSSVAATRRRPRRTPTRVRAIPARGHSAT